MKRRDEELEKRKDFILFKRNILDEIYVYANVMIKTLELKSNIHV